MPLPEPRGRQIEVLDYPEQGHFVILGTAGSGKTTLAIYRALHLSKLCPNRVLLLTFNTTLVKYLDAIAGSALRGIVVENYHKFARGYLSKRGKIPGYNKIVSGIDDEGIGKKYELIKKAIQNVINKSEANSTLKRNTSVFLDEITWIQKMGLTSLEEYENVERTGRAGTRVTRENRRYFYEVYEEYRKVREEENYLYDWDDIASTVYTEFCEDKSTRKYMHIVIDEGQDLSPIMLRSLAKAVPEEGSVTFFGDVAQQIYGSRISWRNAGLNLTKSILHFDANYRNSKEIAQLAKAIAESTYFVDETDLVEPIMPTASSPLPAVVGFSNEKKELEWLVDSVITQAKTQKAVILVRNRESVNKIEKLLRDEGASVQILINKMGVFNDKAQISIGTYHSAKGLEFDTVFLPLCSYERLPSEERIEYLENREEALREEIKLLYVAITRARRGLIISYTNQKTELLPDNNAWDLYNEVTR